MMEVELKQVIKGTHRDDCWIRRIVLRGWFLGMEKFTSLHSDDATKEKNPSKIWLIRPVD